MSDKYDEKAAELVRGWYAFEPVQGTLPKLIAGALRTAAQEARAEAYEDAAKSVECFDAATGIKDCAPCDDCVMAARFRGRASSALPSPEVTPKPCEECGVCGGTGWMVFRQDSTGDVEGPCSANCAKSRAV